MRTTMADEFAEWCENNNVQKVVAALQSGLDVNLRNRYGHTGLLVAIRNGHSNVVEVLLEQDQLDINCIFKDIWASAESYTALHFAVRHEHPEIVRLLLQDPRTDPNIKDKEGNTPLMLALKLGFKACFEPLLFHERVDLDTRDNCQRTGAEVER